MKMMNDIEKAIEQLKSDIDIKKRVYESFALEKSKEHFITCYMTAISALEKQIPKKPVRDRGYVLCPNCKKVEIYWLDKHCHGCGQRLDLEVEE